MLVTKKDLLVGKVIKHEAKEIFYNIKCPCYINLCDICYNRTKHMFVYFILDK